MQILQRREIEREEYYIVNEESIVLMNNEVKMIHHE